MIETTLRIVPTRSVRSLARGERFEVQARYPGGRTIVVARERTRTRAFRAAQRMFRTQTSPTAGGFNYAPGERAGQVWQSSSRQINQIP